MCLNAWSRPLAVLLCGFMLACCYGHVKFHEAVIGPVVRVICVHVVGEWFVPIDDNFQVLVHEYFLLFRFRCLHAIGKNCRMSLKAGYVHACGVL